MAAGSCGRGRALFAALIAALALTACEKAPQPPETSARLALDAVGFDDLPGWRQDRLSEALPALRLSCARLTGRPEATPVGPDGIAGTVAAWRAPCQALSGLADGDDEALRRALRAHFVPFKVSAGGEPRGLFTGYYEAELRGALTSGDGYRWPLYGRPKDVVTVDLGQFRADLSGSRILGRVDGGRLVPYFTRAEIDAGALAGRDLELLWVDDPVDAFFLHVQGSGRVALSEGRTLRVGFAGSNGQVFYAIGRALIEDGTIAREAVSMQAIRDWLRAHPEDAAELMRRNRRYIFFRLIEGAGPIGAQGVPLTAGRSLAVDAGFLPLGAPLWLDTTWPASDRPFRRLMVAQDSGSAIKGAVRGDVFWGFGEPALEQAGRMKQKGVYYLLLPKAVAETRRPAS